MKDQAQLLIDVLLDKSAREDERDDAAIDLRRFKELRVLDALIKIASDPNEGDVIVDNCAESIGEICIGMNRFDYNAFRKLVPFAQKIVFGFIVSHNPELINQSLKNDLAKEFNVNSK